jgi:hypothetical protein
MLEGLCLLALVPWEIQQQIENIHIFCCIAQGTKVGTALPAVTGILPMLEGLSWFLGRCSNNPGYCCIAQGTKTSKAFPVFAGRLTNCIVQ